MLDEPVIMLGRDHRQADERESWLNYFDAFHLGPRLLLVMFISSRDEIHHLKMPSHESEIKIREKIFAFKYQCLK